MDTPPRRRAPAADLCLSNVHGWFALISFFGKNHEPAIQPVRATATRPPVFRMHTTATLHCGPSQVLIIDPKNKKVDYTSVTSKQHPGLANGKNNDGKNNGGGKWDDGASGLAHACTHAVCVAECPMIASDRDRIGLAARSKHRPCARLMCRCSRQTGRFTASRSTASPCSSLTRPAATVILTQTIPSPVCSIKGAFQTCDDVP